METEFLAWLQERLPPHPRLRMGPGDDAALLRLAEREDCFITTDLLCDGVDFRLEEIDARRAGRKCLAVNLSDVAAMAGRPLAAVVALLLPRDRALPLAIELYEGLLPLAEEYEVAIAGGDVNTWSGKLAVSITLVAETAGPPLTRRGARPGDCVLVTGSFGGSILGRHLDFEPRVREALSLNQTYHLHAGIDVSDGLAIDLWRLCEQSGVGACLRTAEVPIAPAAIQLADQLQDGVTPLEHALGDGEDFELILAAPPQEAQKMLAQQPLAAPLTAVGEIEAEPGLRQVDPQGNRRPLEPKGWQY